MNTSEIPSLIPDIEFASRKLHDGTEVQNAQNDSLIIEIIPEKSVSVGFSSATKELVSIISYYAGGTKPALDFLTEGSRFVATNPNEHYRLDFPKNIRIDFVMISARDGKMPYINIQEKDDR